jgi:hypothetical protein
LTLSEVFEAVETSTESIATAEAVDPPKQTQLRQQKNQQGKESNGKILFSLFFISVFFFSF